MCTAVAGVKRTGVMHKSRCPDKILLMCCCLCCFVCLFVLSVNVRLGNVTLVTSRFHNSELTQISHRKFCFSPECTSIHERTKKKMSPPPPSPAPLRRWPFVRDATTFSPHSEHCFPAPSSKGRMSSASAWSLYSVMTKASWLTLLVFCSSFTVTVVVFFTSGFCYWCFRCRPTRTLLSLSPFSNFNGLDFISLHKVFGLRFC